MTAADRVAASHLLDPERWTLSYTRYTATALRRRVLAALNGRP